ncbi:hypothetical protein [Burkholderia ubonensis]|nr:hypothetical protein [Burkholderia ubonensis]
MKKAKSPYHIRLFPAIVIGCVIRWHFRFILGIAAHRATLKWRLAA